MANLSKMNKNQLEKHGRTLGVELDKRQTKANMIAELTKLTVKAKAKPKAKAKAKPKAKAVPKPKPFWQKIADFFGV